ncbi:hypothetical protein RugamoR57_07820 [Duganella caerulea]
MGQTPQKAQGTRIAKIEANTAEFASIIPDMQMALRAGMQAVLADDILHARHWTAQHQKKAPENQGLGLIRFPASTSGCRLRNHSHSMVAGGLPEIS